MPKIRQGKNKYNARKTLIDGIMFDSAAEAHRYKELKLLERAGEICNIRVQVPFIFLLHGKKMFTYSADFVYRNKNQLFVVEDVKGVKTPVYRLKKKLIEAQHEITINEISYRRLDSRQTVKKQLVRVFRKEKL